MAPQYQFNRRRSAAPPYSIRGVLNTNCEAEICIDWLAFTFPIDSKVKNSDLLPTVLGLGDCPVNHAPRGLHGYSKQYEVGGCRVLYAGTPDMGIHVVISGRPLRDHFPEPMELIQHVILLGAKFTRIDIAFDDYAGLIPLSRVVKYTKSGLCATRSRKYKELTEGETSDGEVTGQGLQIGSRTSSAITRFYDKRLERLEALDDDDEKGRESVPEIWNRMEVELKAHSAHEAALKLHTSEDLRAVALGIVSNYISFREKSETDTNKSRWPMADWWSKFVSLVEKIKLSGTKTESTEDSKRKWFVKQVAPSFAYLLHRFGDQHMMEIYKHGVAKLRGEDESLIDRLNDLRKYGEIPF